VCASSPLATCKGETHVVNECQMAAPESIAASELVLNRPQKRPRFGTEYVLLVPPLVAPDYLPIIIMKVLLWDLEELRVDASSKGVFVNGWNRRNGFGSTRFECMVTGSDSIFARVSPLLMDSPQVTGFQTPQIPLSDAKAVGRSI
jgi:hypothetical protein